MYTTCVGTSCEARARRYEGTLSWGIARTPKRSQEAPTVCADRPKVLDKQDEPKGPTSVPVEAAELALYTARDTATGHGV